jgi:hypothetical protein
MEENITNLQQKNHELIIENKKLKKLCKELINKNKLLCSTKNNSNDMQNIVNLAKQNNPDAFKKTY